MAGWVGTVGDVPAARVAGVLLSALGAQVQPSVGAVVELAGVGVPAPADSPAQAWERTGFGAEPVGSPGTLAQAAATLLDVLSTQPVGIDGPGRLGERSALLGLPAAGVVSAGGAARLLPAADGWVAVQLSRAQDVELVPALVADGRDDGEPWARVAQWAASRTTPEIAEQAELLGLAIGVLGAQLLPDAPWRVLRLAPARSQARGPGTVVNLGSLWAGPLCAQLLHRAGYRVIDVESPRRPDGSRLGTPAFHARLHDGHELVVVELETAAGRAELAELLAGTDVVITGSRPAALRRLGAVPAEPPPRDQVWVAITGYGLESERVAFGDDAAVAGGLVRRGPDGAPHFAGDALADPLTGLAGAVAALACARAGGSWRIDAALADVAAYAAALH